MRAVEIHKIDMESGHWESGGAAWDEVSSSFVAGRSSTKSIDYGPLSPTEDELHLLRRLIGDVRGLDILEAGCGGGGNAVRFASQGARVTAVDFSRRQLAHAERTAKEVGVEIKFMQEKVDALERLPDATYDLVFCAHVLPYVENVRQTLAAFRRVLRSGGWLVASMDHPFRSCFYSIDDSSLTNYAERSYYAGGPRFWKFIGTETVMRSYDRTVSQWVEMLAESGLPLQRLLEPPVPAYVLDDLYPEDGALAPLRNIPHTLILAAGGPQTIEEGVSGYA